MPSLLREGSRSECKRRVRSAHVQKPSSVCEYLRSLCERSRSECKRRVQSADTYVRSANAHVRSANVEHGQRMLCSVCEHLRSDANSKFGQRTLRFGLRTLYLVCKHLRLECVRSTITDQTCELSVCTPNVH